MEQAKNRSSWLGAGGGGVEVGGGGGAESLTAEALGTFRERIEKFLRWCFWSIMTIHFTVSSPVLQGQRQCILLVTIPLEPRGACM